MKEDNYAVIVKNLFKSFKLPIEQHSGIKQFLINIFNHKRGYEIQHVLKDASFKIKKGEFFGIVGRNGSGKSTLLKLLAGVYYPDKGYININGGLTPFIELGVGFNPELTGRENVYLNGALLGFSHTDMEAMYDEIVDFAEIERFMDQKLKNYSSGMQVRLAFSIAIRAKSDILLIDEVLAVGDADFQKKCFSVFRELKKQGKTIVLVTHDMGNVERFCDRVLVIDNGDIVAITTPSKASSIYARLNISDSNLVQISDEDKNVSRWGNGGIKIDNISINHLKKDVSHILNFEDSLEIIIKLDMEEGYEKKLFDVGLAFINQDNVNVSGPNSSMSPILPGSKIVKYRLDKSPFQPGDYSVTIAIIDRETNEPFDFYDRAISFHVVSDKAPQGLVSIGGLWSTE